MPWPERRIVVELLGEDLVLGALGVVDERDPAAVRPALQRAQHRHHRGDAGAAGDEDDVLGHLVREDEPALRLGEVHHRAGRRALDEVRETTPSGLARSVIVNRSPWRESGLEIVKTRVVRRAPSTSTPSWTCWPARWPRQVRGGLQGDRGDRRVAGDVDLAVDVDDAGPDLVGGPHRVDLLEVPVDALRERERGDRLRERRIVVVRPIGSASFRRNSFSVRSYTQTLADPPRHGQALPR